MAAEKLERILKLLAELLNASTPKTADELRNKVNMYPENLVAFRKQFSRDKAALKEMGVPLELYQSDLLQIQLMHIFLITRNITFRNLI